MASQAHTSTSDRRRAGSELPRSVNTLVATMRHHAAKYPNKTALTFLVDGESKEETFTYAELDLRARAIAVELKKTAELGDRALLLFPPGLDYIAAFFGCLYAGVIAVPAYPPDPNPSRIKRTLPRLQAIVRDADARFALTTTGIRRLATMLFTQAPDLAALTWLTTDDVPGEAAAGWTLPDVTADSVAFLQYTSGSTGHPRGVMLSHRNLLEEIACVQEMFDHTQYSHAIHWLPPYHDMGLIGGILTPLVGAFPGTLMSPVSFLRRPIRWLNAISRNAGQEISAGGPNFAFELLIRKTTPEQRAELDLSTWVISYTGAEPTRASTLDKFTAAFECAGYKREFIYPCYGLAEATLMVTGADKHTPPRILPLQAAALEEGRVEVAGADSDHDDFSAVRKLVTIGKLAPGHEMLVVDPETCAACAPGVIGELWVRGPIVAQGYWQNPAKTKETFEGYIAGTEQGPYLRTGDLGFIDGEDVFITGRAKDLIIIRGSNHYPQDIEETTEAAHAAIRNGSIAAFAVTQGDAEVLGVAAEVDKSHPSFDADAMISAIRKAISSIHQIDATHVVLIEAKSLPKTSSGKIQRYQARKEYLEGSASVVKADVLGS